MGKKDITDLVDVRIPCKGIMIPKKLVALYGITKEEAISKLEEFYGEEVAIRIY